MPLWVFIVVLVLALCAVAAAIAVPLEFLVFKNFVDQDDTQSSLDQCRSDLDCQNGGTNVVSQGRCSCICTSGFVGQECEVGGTIGCATTNLVSSNGETTVRNVTLGRHVPRIIAHAGDNFTVPLSGTAILAKFSAANMSCIAQNSLIAFNGRSGRNGEAAPEVQNIAGGDVDAALNAALDKEPVFSISALTEPLPTMTELASLGEAFNAAVASDESNSETKLLVATSSPPAPTTTASGSSPTSTGSADGRFETTEDVLDFARVAVLYILQERSTNDAQAAQEEIQGFFNNAADDDGARPEEAASLSVGSNVEINLVDFTLDIGEGVVGSTRSNKRSTHPVLPDELTLTRRMPRRGGSVLAR